jgi:hypothetical protein
MSSYNFRVTLILINLWLLYSFSVSTKIEARQSRETCTIQPRKDGSDDSPAILSAFAKCGHGGRVVFLHETYHIARVMNTTGLRDCQIDIQGTLLVGLYFARAVKTS